MWQISDQFIHNFVEYLFANKEAFSLLINCSGGSPYESFIDNLVAEVERQTYAFLQEMLKKEYPCKKLSSDEIHVLISAQYHAIFEIVRHDLSKEDCNFTPSSNRRVFPPRLEQHFWWKVIIFCTKVSYR